MALSGTLRILASLGVALRVIAPASGTGNSRRCPIRATPRSRTSATKGSRPSRWNGLLQEVAEILDIRLRSGTPKGRIMVRSLGDIALLSRRTGNAAGHETECGALYFAGANLVVIPYYSRTVSDAAARALVVPVPAPAN
jgi:hypothetical protein